MTRLMQDGTAVLDRKSPQKILTAFSELPRNDKLESVAVALTQRANQRFWTIPNIERTDDAELRAMSAAGTIFEPMAQHLTAQGVPTDTVGGVMKTLALSHNDAHMVACDCHEMSGEMDCATAASTLRSLKA